jgi:hypothetical protein
MAASEDAWDIGEEPLLERQDEVLVGGRSIVVLLGQ